MSLAILCSGQGTQHRDMFALTADAPEAADVFAAASDALGRDPRAFVREKNETGLQANAAGQILCVTEALAGFAALNLPLRPRLTIAGYSIGELAAWGCARVFSAKTAIELAQLRASLMDAASGAEDGLAFVRGLRRAAIDGLCARHASAVAIVNPGALFVLGGVRNDLRALCEEALKQGAAKAGALKVNVASHTPRLAAASAGFRTALAAQRTGPRLPGVRLISGIDASAVLNVGAGLDKLAAQISQTIDWAGCLDACIEAGVDTFLELGPGQALAAMAEEAYPGIRARSLDDFRSLDGARAWLDKPAE
jgi:[acyl-carrier-protein] S-malonyltransferase